jgi:hypothetical protein
LLVLVVHLFQVQPLMVTLVIIQYFLALLLLVVGLVLEVVTSAKAQMVEQVVPVVAVEQVVPVVAHTHKAAHAQQAQFKDSMVVMDLNQQLQVAAVEQVQ